MKHIKVTWKIVLLIGLMSAFTLGVGYIGVDSVSGLHRETDAVAESGQEALTAAKLNQDVLRLSRAEYEIASEPDAKTLQDAGTAIQRQRGEFERRLDRLQKEAAPDQKKLLGDIRQRYQQYSRDVDATLALARRLGSSVVIDEAQRKIVQSVDASSAAAHALQEAVNAYAAQASDSAEAQVSEASARAEDADTAMLTAAGIGVLTGIGLGLLMGIMGIGRPLGRIIEVVGALSRADTGIRIEGTERKDEFGDIARAMEVFKGNLEEKTRLESEAAEQRRERERQREERETRERRAGEEIARLCEQIAAGDLTRRIETGDKDGFLLEMARQMNELSAMLQAITDEQSTVVAALADGDLTTRIDGDYRGVFGRIRDDMNVMITALHGMVGKVAETVGSLKGAAGEISAGSKDLAQRTESQAASLEETAASMHQVTTMVQNNAENASAANQLAAAARDTADKGGQVVRDVVSAMGQIEGSAQRISDIVSLIDEIAFQTNLLALNAGVEAARAGEAGKGFAVVASEVRALAQRSSEAAREIDTLIKTSSEQVGTGVKLVGDSGEQLKGIVAEVVRINSLVSEMAQAAQQQSTGIEEVNVAVNQMDQMTQQNAAMVEESTAASRTLATETSELNKLVSYFKVGDGVAAAAEKKSRPAADTATRPAIRVVASGGRQAAAAVASAAPADETEWEEF